eukprot:34508-Eustigmatos_ZCMA.PRE.1
MQRPPYHIISSWQAHLAIGHLALIPIIQVIRCGRDWRHDRSQLHPHPTRTPAQKLAQCSKRGAAALPR